MSSPRNLDECLAVLPTLLGETDTVIFQNTPEEEIPFKYEEGLGRWIRNEWKLQYNSELALHFKRLGVSYAGNMSSLILHIWHRHLNKKPLNVHKIITAYH